MCCLDPGPSGSTLPVVIPSPTAARIRGTPARGGLICRNTIPTKNALCSQKPQLNVRDLLARHNPSYHSLIQSLTIAHLFPGYHHLPVFETCEQAAKFIRPIVAPANYSHLSPSCITSSTLPVRFHRGRRKGNGTDGMARIDLKRLLSRFPGSSFTSPLGFQLADWIAN